MDRMESIMWFEYLEFKPVILRCHRFKLQNQRRWKAHRVGRRALGRKLEVEAAELLQHPGHAARLELEAKKAEEAKAKAQKNNDPHKFR